MLDEPRAAAAKLQELPPAAIDQEVARLLTGTPDDHWRALFVTELRLAKVWPESERARGRTSGC